MNKKIELFMKKLEKMPDNNRVKFVYLFGSYATGKAGKLSDIDFAVYYDAPGKERFKFRIKFSAEFDDEFDILIFQDLPLYIQMEVLKGKVIYAKDERFVYDKAYETIKKFDDFKKYYYDYIEYRRLGI